MLKLSEASGIAYRGGDEHRRLVLSRLRDGIHELELRAVIAYCADEWHGKSDLAAYLRPETLFGPKTIHRYLDAARTKYARELRDAGVIQPQPKLEVVK